MSADKPCTPTTPVPNDTSLLHAPRIEEQLKSIMPLVPVAMRIRIARAIAQLREDSLLRKTAAKEVTT